MRRDIFLFGGGAVVTALANLFPTNSLLWAIVLIAGLLLMAGSALHAIRRGSLGQRQLKGWFRMSPILWGIIGVMGAVIAALSFYQAYAVHRDGWPVKFQLGGFLNITFNQTIKGFEVWGFQGGLINVSGNEVKLETAYIISGKSGQRLPVLFSDGYGKHLDPSDFNPMPPLANAHFRALFKSETIYISESDFWNQWGPITFVANYGGREYRRFFSVNEIEEQFAAQRPPPTQPRMTPSNIPVQPPLGSLVFDEPFTIKIMKKQSTGRVDVELVAKVTNTNDKTIKTEGVISGKANGKDVAGVQVPIASFIAPKKSLSLIVNIPDIPMQKFEFGTSPVSGSFLYRLKYFYPDTQGPSRETMKRITFAPKHPLSDQVGSVDEYDFSVLYPEEDEK